MIKQLLTAAAAAAALSLPGAASANSTEDFVTANILATLYHELGHALIDIEGVPIFGQEEDAADVLSVLLIDAFYEEEDAVALAYDTAFGFQGEAEAAADEGYEPAFWDVHGPDEQRYYNLVCLFYGANPEERDDVAQELGLPEDRALTCPEEFDLANESWGAVLEDLEVNAPGDTITLGAVEQKDAVAALLAEEIALLNQDYALSTPLTVHYAACGEANAYYDPEAVEITICTEYTDHLAELAD